MINKFKRNNGITLIALVVTIIVLLILAGVAISMLAGDNGILQQAAKAKETTDEQSTLEQIKLAATAALTNTEHKIRTTGELKAELNKYFEKYEIYPNVDEEAVEEWTVTANGVNYVIKNNGTVEKIDNETENTTKWYYAEDGSITNGSKTINLGDKIDYNPKKNQNGDDITDSFTSPQSENGHSNQTFSVSSTEEKEWRVLGVDDKGQILIMPTTSVKTTEDTYFYLGNLSDVSLAQSAYLNAEKELDKISEIYGKGKGATGARSVKIEDIDKITGYDKTTYEQNESYGYGNKVTYSCEEDGKTTYSWTQSDGTKQSGTEDASFTYWTGSEWKTLNKGDSVTLTSTYYEYAIESDSINQNVYNLLFDEPSNDTSYWIGSSTILTHPGFTMYAFHLARAGDIYAYYLYDSMGNKNEYSLGVRPVVSLKSDITLEENGENSWTIK